MDIKYKEMNLNKNIKLRLIEAFHDMYFDTDLDTYEFGEEFYEVTQLILTNRIPLELNYLSEWEDTINEILEMQTKKIGYLIAEINTDQEDPCHFTIAPYCNKYASLETFNKKIDEWEESWKSENIDFYDDVEKALDLALMQEYDTDDYKCVHYVFEDGSEKIFEWTAQEIM